MRDIMEINHWQAGKGYRCTAKSLDVDRKTVQKHIRAAVEAGSCQDGHNTSEEW